MINFREVLDNMPPERRAEVKKPAAQRVANKKTKQTKVRKHSAANKAVKKKKR